jgi:hypothetical protein
MYCASTFERMGPQISFMIFVRLYYICEPDQIQVGLQHKLSIYNELV